MTTLSGTWCDLLMFIFYFIKVCKGADGGLHRNLVCPVDVYILLYQGV